MSKSMNLVLEKGICSRVMVMLESFPFFMTGRLVAVHPGRWPTWWGSVVIEAQEGVPVQLAGRAFHISQGSIAAFFIESKEFPIPRLESVDDYHPGKKHPQPVPAKELREILGEAAWETDENAEEAEEKGAEMAIRRCLGRDVLFVLRPKQLSVLGQVFRPVIVARLAVVGLDFVFLQNVNIRFSNAPDFVFPLPLFVPKQQIALFLPFERQTQFPLV